MEDVKRKLSVVRRLKAQGATETQIQAHLAKLDQEQEAMDRASTRPASTMSDQLKGVLLVPNQGDFDELKKEFMKNNPDRKPNG